MFEALIALGGGFVAGGVVVAWRLKGDMTIAQTLKAVIQGGGGPKPTK